MMPYETYESRHRKKWHEEDLLSFTSLLFRDVYKRDTHIRMMWMKTFHVCDEKTSSNASFLSF